MTRLCASTVWTAPCQVTPKPPNADSRYTGLAVLLPFDVLRLAVSLHKHCCNTIADCGLERGILTGSTLHAWTNLSYWFNFTYTFVDICAFVVGCTFRELIVIVIETCQSRWIFSME